jgi:hypothetical protein
MVRYPTRKLPLIVWAGKGQNSEYYMHPGREIQKGRVRYPALLMQKN